MGEIPNAGIPDLLRRRRAIVINVEGVFYNPDTIFRVVRMRPIDGGAEVISQLKNFEGS
jgi:hypothetical protein